MVIERCEECGCDGEQWTDTEVMAAVAAALTEPGTDLGQPPQSQFDPEQRVIDIEASLPGISDEAGALPRPPPGLMTTVGREAR